MEIKKFIRYKQNKLWRDKTIGGFKPEEAKINYKVLATDEDFSKALRLKLLEEVNEVLLAEKKHELQEEIADVLTVIEELVKLHKIPMDVMLEIKNSKKEQRGGFEKRYFVSDVEFLEGSFGDLYCKKQPNKYEKIN